jgi:hypothetical protein
MEMCRSVRTFTRASLDAEGMRRAWFLPFGALGDGEVDFYAPMASNPGDDASSAFYHQRVGQLTHYLVAPEFAEALASCLRAQDGYVRSCRARTEETFRASFVDHTTARAIEISASNGITGVLIVRGTWDGDIQQALRFGSRAEWTSDNSAAPACQGSR